MAELEPEQVDVERERPVEVVDDHHDVVGRAQSHGQGCAFERRLYSTTTQRPARFTSWSSLRAEPPSLRSTRVRTVEIVSPVRSSSTATRAASPPRLRWAAY